MAWIDELVAQIADAPLRQKIEAALTDVRRREKFGLVFEEHIPETTALLGIPVRVGSLVQRRDDTFGRTVYRVTAVVPGGEATLESTLDGSPERALTSDLAVVQRFGEPIYPALTPMGAVRCGPPEKPHHAVIRGENYHALQHLLYLYEGQVDCIYIDPPYNTGARDWKYNNHYVDERDAWRHSKWLSFMEKRLRIAKRLLKRDSVLIVTIDENEVHHLGMLLERLLPEARRQMVTICINPSGASSDGLSRVEEYAFFCFLGATRPVPTSDDMLTDTAVNGFNAVRWEALMRGGNAWYRASRPNLCYPVILNSDGSRIVGVGEPFVGDDEGERPRSLDGHPLAWPVRSDGRLGIWRVAAARLRQLGSMGYAYVSSGDSERGTWTIRYLLSGTIEGIEDGSIEIIGTGEHGEVLLQPRSVRRTTAKTMWRRGRHTAGGAGGTHILASLLGKRDVFPFPKSVYAVRDCLAVAVGDRPDALIVDFFAGSGTTLHATCLLNAEDFGRRRSVLVTNNEVDELTTRRLATQGIYRGDPAFEDQGIFEQVTRPRCEAAITGRQPSGAPAPGTYIDGHQLRDGFLENVEFYHLAYLDPDEVELGFEFMALLPSLWLAAGGVGNRELPAEGQSFSLPIGSNYGVLFQESRLRQFLEALRDRPDVTHIWLVTDSDEAYAEMRSALPAHTTTAMLYRDYLHRFRRGAERPA